MYMLMPKLGLGNSEQIRSNEENFTGQTGKNFGFPNKKARERRTKNFDFVQ